MIPPAVLLLARVEVRRRWRALVALGLLAGLVGAVVLGVLHGARRTATAYDRLRESTGYWDAQAFFGSAPDDVIDEILALPNVEASWQMHLALGRRDAQPGFPDFGVGAGPLRPSGFYRPIVVEGRLPATDVVSGCVPYPPVRSRHAHCPTAGVGAAVGVFPREPLLGPTRTAATPTRGLRPDPWRLTWRQTPRTEAHQTALAGRASVQNPT